MKYIDQVLTTKFSLSFQVFGITVQSCWFFGQGAPYIAIFSAAQEAASRAFFVIASVPTINTSKSKCKRPVDLKGNLKFKNVCFCYPSRKEVKVSSEEAYYMHLHLW